MTTKTARELLLKKAEWQKEKLNRTLEEIVNIIQDRRTRNNWDAEEWADFFTRSSRATLEEIAEQQAEIEAQLQLLDYLEEEEQ